jgi:hypothetical protein
MQDSPASRPADNPGRELKPFGDELVAQPRIAVDAEFSEGLFFPRKRKPPKSTRSGFSIVGQRGLDVIHTWFDAKERFEPAQVLLQVKSGAAMRRGPRVAAWGDRVVVTAPEGGDATQRRILCVTSSDCGKSWSTPIPITDKLGVAAEGFHDLCVTTSGAFIVAWLDLRDGDGQSLYTSRSEDGGSTWSANTRVYSPGKKGVCECCPLSIAAGPLETVGIVFRNHLAKFRDLHFLLSRDDGRSYQEPLKLPGQTWELTGCPMAEGAVAFQDAFGDGGRGPVWPVVVNARDGELFVPWSDYTSKDVVTYSLGRGRRPTAHSTGWTYTIAFVREPDYQLSLVGYEADGALRRFDFPARTDDEMVDSPSLGDGWAIYEVKSKGKVMSRMQRVPPRFNAGSEVWKRF